MDDFCHVFVLTSLSIDENGEVKRRNVAVTFDLFEAEDHRNRGVEHEYDVFVVPGDWRDDAEQSCQCRRERSNNDEGIQPRLKIHHDQQINQHD
jgi:hypothetical protein